MISLRPRSASGLVRKRQIDVADNRTLLSVLFGFTGRIRRREYWAISFGSFAVFGLLLIGMATDAKEEADGLSMATYLGGLLSTLLYFWVNLACNVQRWHDRNKSGFWTLISLVPFIGWVWALIETAFLPGTPDRNRFGPPPGQKRRRTG